VSSAELYTSKSYGYGRFEARVRMAAGDGVVSTFFLWKDGSERAGTFWNELDFEKTGADCRLHTNPNFGLPLVDHSRIEPLMGNLCEDYHTYVYEWTPDYIAWSVDGTEVRRETGATAAAYADNASTQGMQIRFNIWPGDSTFGGTLDPAILPVSQHIDWVQYSSYADGGFTVEMREDFNGATLPSGWLLGTWASSKNLSIHSPLNFSVADGSAVLSLTTSPGATQDSGANGGTGDADSGAMSTGSKGSSGCSLSSSRSTHAGFMFCALGLTAIAAFGLRRAQRP
jgi:beta-glucanase (GH16 family)